MTEVAKSRARYKSSKGRKQTEMKKVLLAFTVIIMCTAADQPVNFLFSNWMDLLEELEPDSLLPRQEQAPTRLRCPVCLEPLSLDNCTAKQTLRLCETGFSCYTLQAFETMLNTYIFAKGCFPEFLCNGNHGCEFLNRSRNGTIDSCSFQCCHTDQCNAGPSVSPPVPSTEPSPPVPSTEPSPPDPSTEPSSPIPSTEPSPSVPSTEPSPPVPSTEPSPPVPSTEPSPPVPSTEPSPPVPSTEPSPPVPSTEPTTVSTTSQPTRTTSTTAPTSIPGQCGGTLTSPSGKFASPNYPGNYPNNAHCVWTITVPQGAQFKIEFFYFFTERRYDYVKVYVGRRLVSHLTGKVGVKGKISSIQGTGELISIVFRTDHSVTKRGFFAKYSVQRALSCGGSLTGSSGNFKSPGYPGNYPNDVECKWTITVPRKASLLIAFRTFDTERCHDYVKVFRGRRLVRRLSGRYGRYGRYRGGDDKRFLSQEDDDCDDDDDEDDYDKDSGNDDNNNDHDHDENDVDNDISNNGDSDSNHSALDNLKRTYRRYAHVRQARSRHVSRMRSRYGFRSRSRYGSRGKGRYGSRMRNRYRSPYVATVSIRGTGEQITIIFKSSRRNTRKGFDAMYRILRGYYGR